MATQTVMRKGVTHARPHDHIYDPTYTVSSSNAYLQDHQAARMDTVERIPKYDSMFSDVWTHPRHEFRMKPGKIVMPPFPPKGQMKPAPPNDVLGPSRYKYFKRPIIPYLHSVPAEVLLAPVRDAANATDAGVEEAAEMEVPLHRTLGVQTMYRESETQTDPYTRDYITAPNQEEPEILKLMHLTFGHGLPASLEEINMIHRMREKKAFEASLPPITDEASFQVRRKMLEERELQEWNIREEEMKKEQEDRLQILIDTLKIREEKSEALSDARVDKVRQQKMREREEMVNQIHRHRIKVHRTLGKARTMILPQSKQRDIIAEHADHASKVYAPVAREGRLPVKNQVVDYGIPLISNYQGLSDLEKRIDRKLIEVKPQSIGKIVLQSTKTRKGQQISADLAYVDELLRENKRDKPETKIENVYKKFEPVTRAQTFSVVEPEDDRRQQAILLLQRLIRGRAVQNTMYKGKQKTLQLIRELRIQENPPQPKAADPKGPEKKALDALQGEILSNALDFISKEVVRVAEERKIANLVKIATQTRRFREAEEAGRRQAEYLIRCKRTQQYQGIMSVHQATSSLFLDEIFANAMQAVPHKKAVHEASVKANMLDLVVGEVEDTNNNPEFVVQDLIAEFLLPEVERRRTKNKTQLESRRFMLQAHASLLDVLGTVLETADNEYRQSLSQEQNNNNNNNNNKNDSHDGDVDNNGDNNFNNPDRSRESELDTNDLEGKY